MGCAEVQRTAPGLDESIQLLEISFVQFFGV
jgi:hypothetical protein